MRLSALCLALDYRSDRDGTTVVLFLGEFLEMVIFDKRNIAH